MTDPYERRAGLYEAIVDRLNSSLHQVALRTHPVGPGTRVLDVGCGTGAQLDLYAGAGCDVAGVDLSPAMLQRARARLGDRADLRLADARVLPHADSAFDVVLASLVLHELTAETRSGILEEIARVLAVDGVLVVVDFGAGPLTIGGRLRRIVSTGFELAAGRDHFEAFRTYLAAGGLTSALATSPLTEERAQSLGGGDLSVVVARHSTAS